MSDMHLIAGFLTFFILLGLSLPVINSGFDTDYNGVSDINAFGEELEDNANNSQLSIWRVLGSLISVFFWSFGELPVLANVLLLIPRTIFILTVARNIWIGGGS